MTYGFGTRALSENGASQLRPERSLPQHWRTLSEACRLALIERALAPANVLNDGFPAAL